MVQTLCADSVRSALARTIVIYSFRQPRVFDQVKTEQIHDVLMCRNVENRDGIWGASNENAAAETAAFLATANWRFYWRLAPKPQLTRKPVLKFIGKLG
jgi:hypothetical protein